MQASRVKCPSQFLLHCYEISFILYVLKCHYFSYNSQISPYFLRLGPHTLIIKLPIMITIMMTTMTFMIMIIDNYNDYNNDDADDDNYDDNHDNEKMIMIMTMKTAQTPCQSL